MIKQDEIINEVWRSISEYMNYQVSNIGRVRNTETGKILKHGMGTTGYYIVSLTKDGVKKTRQVHKLVADEFLDKPEIDDTLLVVDHIDHDRLNNQVSNLRYVTRSQNNMKSRKRSNTSSKFKGVC